MNVNENTLERLNKRLIDAKWSENYHYKKAEDCNFEVQYLEELIAKVKEGLEE